MVAKPIREKRLNIRVVCGIGNMARRKFVALFLYSSLVRVCACEARPHECDAPWMTNCGALKHLLRAGRTFVTAMPSYVTSRDCFVRTDRELAHSTSCVTSTLKHQRNTRARTGNILFSLEYKSPITTTSTTTYINLFSNLHPYPASQTILNHIPLT